MSHIAVKNIEIREEFCKTLPCCSCGQKIHIQNGIHVCQEGRLPEFDPFYFERYSKINGKWIVIILSLLTIFIGGGLYNSLGIWGIFISSGCWIICTIIIQNVYKNKRKKYKQEIEKTYHLNAAEKQAWDYYMSLLDSKSKILD